MDREQLKGKQTPGKWIVIASWNDYVITVDGLENDVIVWQDGAYDTPTMTEADATLAAEAGNVANRTGMWPKDLLDRVKELEEGLQDMVNWLEIPQMGSWQYMEGEGFYADKQKKILSARAILNKKP